MKREKELGRDLSKCVGCYCFWQELLTVFLPPIGWVLSLPYEAYITRSGAMNAHTARSKT
jgi:hypothetical protein